MDTLFFLRSFGDFVVAMSELKNARPSKEMRMVASIHLKDLYDTLHAMGVLPLYPSIHFTDFRIRHNLMACFTNRHFFSTTSWAELRALKAYIKRQDEENVFFLEQSVRRSLVELVSGKSFKFVHDGTGNIYDAYARFWGGTVADNTAPCADILSAGSRIILTPGSRKRSKMLPVSLVKHLTDAYSRQGHTVVLAGLPGELLYYPVQGVAYHNFRELVTLVAEADKVISADSLPAHLAQLLGKPHEIYYHRKVNEAWKTRDGVVRVIGTPRFI